MATGDRHRPRPLHLRAPNAEPFTLAQNIAVQCLSPTLPRDLPPDLLQRTRELEADQRRIIADRHQAGLKGQPTEETQRAADVKPHQIVYHTPRRTHFGDDYEAPLSASEGHRPKPKPDPDASTVRSGSKASSGPESSKESSQAAANKSTNDDDDDDDEEEDDDEDDDADEEGDDEQDDDEEKAEGDRSKSVEKVESKETAKPPRVVLESTVPSVGSTAPSLTNESDSKSDVSAQPEVAEERQPIKNIHVPRAILVPALPPDKPSSAPGSPNAAIPEGHQRPFQQAPHSAPPYPVPQQAPFQTQRLPSIRHSPEYGQQFNARSRHPQQAQQYAGSYGQYSQSRTASYHSHSHSQGQVRQHSGQHGAPQDPHSVHAQARLKQQQQQQQHHQQSRAQQQARHVQQAYASQHYGSSANQAYASHPRQRGLQTHPGYRYSSQNSYPPPSGMQWQLHGLQRQLDELQYMQRTVLEAVLQQYQVMSTTTVSASSSSAVNTKPASREAAPLHQLADAAAAQLAQLAPRLQSQLDYLAGNNTSKDAHAAGAAPEAVGEAEDEDRALDIHYRLQTAAGERAKGRRTAVEELRNATIIPSPRLQVPSSQNGPLPGAPEPQLVKDAPENDPRRTTLAARRGGRVMTLNVNALNPASVSEPLSAQFEGGSQPQSPELADDARRRAEDGEDSADRKRRKTDHNSSPGSSDATPSAGSSPVLIGGEPVPRLMHAHAVMSSTPEKPPFPANLAASLSASLPGGAAGLGQDRRGQFLSLCEQIYELFDTR